MKNTFLLTICLIAGIAVAQQKIDPNKQINWPLATGSGAPSFSCASLNYGQPYYDVTNNISYVCTPLGWYPSGLNGPGITWNPTLQSLTVGTGPGSGGCVTITDTGDAFKQSICGLATSTGNQTSYYPQAAGYLITDFMLNTAGKVNVNAGNVGTGTLPHAQLPALVSGDIPNNAANTSGTAANVTGIVSRANGGTGVNNSANFTQCVAGTTQFPCIVAVNNQTGLSAAVATTTILASAASANYRMCMTLITTSVGGATGGTISGNASYNNGSATNGYNVTGSVVPTTLGAEGPANNSQCREFYVGAVSAIQFYTSYAPTGGTPVYTLRVTLEQMTAN